MHFKYSVQKHVGPQQSIYFFSKHIGQAQTKVASMPELNDSATGCKQHVTYNQRELIKELNSAIFDYPS